MDGVDTSILYYANLSSHLLHRGKTDTPQKREIETHDNFGVDCGIIRLPVMDVKNGGLENVAGV